MSIRAEKLENEKYFVELTLTLNEGSSIDSLAHQTDGKREKLYTLEGFSSNQLFTLVCAWKLSVKRRGYLAYPFITEFRVLLKCEDVRIPALKPKARMWNLSSVNVSINNGCRYSLSKYPGDNASWEIALSSTDRLFGYTESTAWTEIANIKLWIEFSFSGSNTALKDFGSMFKNQVRCDVTFLFNSGHRIGAHIPVLMVRSPVFHAMFTYDTKEALSCEVHVPDIDPDIFEHLLQYLYCGELCNTMNQHNALGLLTAANKYQIDDLACDCETFLSLQVNEENVVAMLIIAEVHSSNIVREAALEFLTNNFYQICHSVEWEQLTNNNPKLCLLATRRMANNLLRICNLRSKVT